MLYFLGKFYDTVILILISRILFLFLETNIYYMNNNLSARSTRLFLEFVQ